MSRRFYALALTTLALAALPAVALAADGVSVVKGTFTNKIESGKPVGDPSSIGPGQTATYWVEVNNPNDATQITLVWKLDGAESGKQTLDVGRAPHWRTWGSWPTKKAHAVEVVLLDNDGRELHKDALSFEGK